MLILTRRVGEKIIVQDDITITVLGAKGSQLRLGIDAPSHISVHRQEVYQRIQAEKQSLNEKNNRESTIMKINKIL